MNYRQERLDKIINHEHGFPPFRIYFRYNACSVPEELKALVAASFLSLPDALVLGMIDDDLYLPWDERMEEA